MIRALSSLLALSLCACPPITGLDDSGGTPDPDTGVDPGQNSTAVITTVASDYTTGTFATVDLESWEITDELFVTSGDPSVSVSEGAVFQLNRYGYDAVRRYEPGSWNTPLWEVAFEDLSNPHVARVCDGAVFVTLYDQGEVGVYDLDSGEALDSVDLSAFDDADSSGPEPSTMVLYDGKLYVGLERLERDDGWVDAGGMVVEIDCAQRAVTRSWSVGGNTAVHAWLEGEGVLVRARAFGDDAGGLYALDPAADSLELRVDMGDEQPSEVGAYGGAAVVTSQSADWSSSSVHHLDLAAGTIVSSQQTDAYYTDVAANDWGQAWVTTGESWMNPDAPSGLWVYDISDGSLVSDVPIQLSLHPRAVAFY